MKLTDDEIKVCVDTDCVEKATQKVEELCATIEMAKSLAGDLAKMLEGLTVKVYVDG